MEPKIKSKGEYMSIQLINVCRYYQDLPHQNEALEYLQSRIDPNVLATFSKGFRSKPEADVDNTHLGRITRRLRELNISLIKPTKGYNAYVIAFEGYNTDLKANGDKPDAWNDAVCVLAIDANGKLEISDIFQCTTEPGRHYIENRLNPKGAAFVLTDVLHKDIWIKGTHKDQPNCLIQEGNTIEVRRDQNGDGIRGTAEPLDEGWFGINLHHTKGNYDPKSIGRWSAGCCVLPNPQQHRYLVDIASKAQNKKISYVILSKV